MEPLADERDDILGMHMGNDWIAVSTDQVGGNHYRETDIQPWDAIESWSHEDQAPFEAYLWGNAIKYIQRYRRKGRPVEDIGKAIHYLQQLEEVLDGNA